MTPKFSLKECLKRYLRELLHLETNSPPRPESLKEWEAERKAQREDIRCVKY